MSAPDTNSPKARRVGPLIGAASVLVFFSMLAIGVLFFVPDPPPADETEAEETQAEENADAETD